MNSRFCVQIRTILLKWKGWNGAWRVFCKLRKFVIKCDMSHLRFFFGPFITKTIANHRTWIWVKPLKNHRCQWSICKKTFNGDGQGVAKPLKNHRWQWCPEEKTLPSHRLKKNDHRWSLIHSMPSPNAQCPVCFINLKHFRLSNTRLYRCRSQTGHRFTRWCHQNNLEIG